MTSAPERLRCLAIVPARAGSKRIPGKNLKLLGSVPLIDYTLRAARAAQRIGCVLVSTESDAIAAHARACGAEVPVLRPSELAHDDSPVTAALQHVLEAYEARAGQVDAVVLLQPTSPFRGAVHIDQAIALFERTGADTVTAVRAAREHPYWAWRRAGDTIVPFLGEAEMQTERLRLPEALIECGAVYVARRALVVAGRLYGERVVPYLIEGPACLDIDEPQDWAWAEYLLAQGLVDTAVPGRA